MDVNGSQTTRPPASPDVVTFGKMPPVGRLHALARLIGTRIDTRALAEDPLSAGAAAQDELTFVFRYGAVVTIATAPPAAPHRIDAMLTGHVTEPFDVWESERTAISVSGGEDGIDPLGRVLLAALDEERLLLVATVLARSVVLARDEMQVSEAFDRSASVVADLQTKGRVRQSIEQVKRRVGDVLAARHRVVGAVQVADRPDLLWDRPQLDRLYNRLEADYELRERAEVLERKLGALGDLSEALLDIVQDKRAFRLEMGIILLIAFEIVLTLSEKL